MEREPVGNQGIVLLTVAVGSFMATLNLSIVNVSLPTIVAHFEAGIVEAQLVVVSYVAVVTALLLTMGRLGDVYGRRRSYTVGFALFTAGAAACGFAPGILELLSFRAFQAVGAAMLIASGPAVVAEAFPSRRGQAIGLLAIAVAAGLTTGNVLGGILVELAGWRWIFLANVPVGLAGFALARSYVPATRVDVRMDWRGAALFAAAVLLLLSAFGAPQDARLPLIVASVLALSGFLLSQRDAKEPLLPPDLVRDRFVVLGTASVLVAFTAMATSSLLVPFYLARVLGESPAAIGLVLLANPLGFSLVGPLSGRTHDRLAGRAGTARLLSPLGLAVSAGGFVALSGLSEQGSTLLVFVELFLVGVGMGLFTAPNNSALLGAVARENLGALSGLIATMRNLGMSLGLALAGQLFLFLNPLGIHASPAGFSGAMGGVFLAAAGLLLFGAVLSLARPERDPHVPASPTPTGATARSPE